MSSPSNNSQGNLGAGATTDTNIFYGVGGALQANLMKLGGELTESEMEISHWGTLSLVHSMTTELDAANSQANATITATNNAVDQLNVDGASSLASGTFQGASMLGQAYKTSTGNSADAAQTKILNNQKNLSDIAADPQGALVRQSVGEGNDNGVEMTDMKTSEENATQFNNKIRTLCANNGRNLSCLTDDKETAQMISYWNKVDPNTSELPKLSEFQTNLNKTIEGTQNELSNIRQQTNSARATIQEGAQALSALANSAGNFVKAPYKTAEGTANAAGIQDQATTQNAATCVQTGQKFVTGASDASREIAQSIEAAIRANNAA